MSGWGHVGEWWQKGGRWRWRKPAPIVQLTAGEAIDPCARSPLYFYAHTVITQRHTMWSHSGTHCHICNFLLFKLTSSSWWSWVIVIVCSCVMFLNSNALVTIKDHAQILPTHMHIMRRIFYVVDINISIMKYFLRQHLLMFEATYHWGNIHLMNFVDFSPVEKMKPFL